MVMTRREFKNFLLNHNPREVCEQHLFNDDVYLFDEKPFGERGTFYDFRSGVAKIVETTPESVFIVGSAKFGFSMNFNKSPLLKAFHSKSDLDLLIISEGKFEQIWADLRRANALGGHSELKEAHMRPIFEKFVFIEDKIEHKSTYLIKHTKLISEIRRFASLKHRIKQKINYRIYSALEDATNYHYRGIEILSRSLMGPRGAAI